MLAAGVVAVLIGGLGGGAIFAATAGSSPAMGGAARGQMHGPPPGSGGPKPARAPASDGPTGVLHSEYVVADGNGGFTTRMTQTGVVDEATLSTIVVRSADGYVQIYAFPSAAVTPATSVAANDTVTVEATRIGTTVTLNRITEAPPPVS